MPSCAGEEITVNLAALPATTGIHLLQVQNPGGLFSNEFIFLTENPEVSDSEDGTDKKWDLSSAMVTADERRQKMIDVCLACHQQRFVDNFFVQYEALIELYEVKYATPGEELYNAAVAVLKTNPDYVKFSEPIDWTWFELWHHEGRRARHGASMMAPDYTHWHGTYDLAKHWMTKFIPEIKEIIHKHEADPKAKKQVAKLKEVLDRVQNSDEWKWSINKEDDAVKKAREEHQKEFLERYE